MKHLKLFFALFAMLALGVTNAWAEETEVYTLTPAKGSNNAYAGNCDITINDITWNLTGNSTMIPWRIGGKSLTNIDRTLYSKTAMPHKVTKVEVTHGTNSTTVNSFKLIVASDANFSNVISTVDATFEVNTTTTLACPTGADWTNAYYKFVYNVTIGSSNKYLQFSEAKFYGEASTTPGEGGGEDPTPGTGETTNWVETPIGDITASDMVVVTMTNASGSTYAMSNNNGTSKAPTATMVEVSDGKLTQEPADEYKWNISNTSGTLIFYPNGDATKWLYCTSTNNGVRVGTNTASAFTIDAESGGYLKHTGTSRYLGVYSSQDWRCYTTSTTTNIANQILKFYKYLDPNAATKPSAPRLTDSQEFETETFTVEISADAGTTIYYTLNGDEPTAASNQYTAPFTINATTTVKAIAVKDGVASSVNSATYTKVSTIDKTCAEAAAACSSTTSTDKYRVEGYVTEIVTAYNADFKNISFWMADTKNGGQVLQAYRAKEETVDQYKNVKVGDKVQVVGKVVLYKSTPEFIEGSLYKITEVAPIYNVTINSDHGTVTADPMSGIEGTEVTLTVEPASGWVFDSWTVKDASNNDVAVADNKFTIPASNVTVTANYTASEAPDAVLNLMANGEVHATINKKVGEKTELPATIENDCKKVFVGWDANENCNQAPTYAPGAEYTLEAENQTLYAVYATETAGSQNTSTISIADYATANSWADATKYTQIVVGDITASVTGGGNTGKYYENGNNWRLYQGESATITIAIPENLSLSTIKFTYTVSNSGVLLNGTTKVTSNDVVSVNGSSATFSVGNTGTATNGQVRITAIEVVYNSAPTYSDYSTTCVGALAAPTFSVAEGEYTEAKSITLSATEGTIYYTLDGTTPTSESTQYTEAIVLDVCGEYTIKAIAISSDNESPVASATYKMDLDIATGSVDAPLTTTEAKQLYESGCYNDEPVYVTGQVKNAQFYTSSNTYTITLTDGFQFYKFYDLEGAEFEEDYIKPGDVIVGYGTIDLYNSNYQLAAGCYLVDYTPNENELISIKNTVETAYTVEEARNFIDNGATYDLSEEVYVKGIVSKIVTPFDATYGNISYNISTDGTTTSAQLQAYRGLSMDGALFESENDILVGDEVVVVGTLTKYGSTYEFNAYNKLVSKVRKEEPTPEPEVPAVEPTATFIFNTADGLSNLGITYPATDGGSGALMTEFEDGAIYTQDGITMTTTNGDTKTRVWQKSGGDLDLRIYKNASLTLSVGKDLVISNVVFTGKNITNLKVDNVAVSNNSWTGNKQSVTFDVTASANIYTIAITVSYTRSISANYGTICLPYGSSNYSGAEFYEVSSLVVGQGLWLDQLAAGAALEAGKPYIFKATANKIVVAYEGSAASSPAAGVNGLTGTFTDIDANGVLVGNYIIADNKVWVANNQNTLPANRAYIANTVPTTEQPQLPGRRRVCMGENAATGFDNIVAPEGQAVKVIENGQLIIIRDGVKYNVQGQKL